MRPGARALAPLLVAAASCVAAAPACAQSRIQADVDTTLVTVGDRITMTVAVDHPAGTRVVWPDSLRLAPFEVLDATVGPARTTGDRSVTVARLSLAAFELGELEIPPIEVSVVGAEGGEPETLATDRFGIEVVTVGADDTGDIRDIRGPLWIPVSLLRVGLAGLLLLLPALLAFVLYRRFRAGRGDAAPAPRAAPPRPAHELALEALAALEASPLLERGQVKEYHIEVSDILRTYVERRFGVDALEMTTREVLGGLAEVGLDREVVEPLGRFLTQCDMVKFAKVRPDDADSLAVLRLGRDIVERTIPVVAVPDVDAVPVEAS